MVINFHDAKQDIITGWYCSKFGSQTNTFFFLFRCNVPENRGIDLKFMICWVLTVVYTDITHRDQDVGHFNTP